MAKIFIPKIGRQFDIIPDQSILRAAIEAGINYPQGCTIGRCGACKSRLISGDIKSLANASTNPSHLKPEDDLFLACQNTVVSEATIEWLNDGLAPRFNHWQRATIVFSEMAAPEIAIVRLKLDSRKNFTFAAGQFLTLAMPNVKARYYSMASTPNEDLVELHIGIVRDGQSSGAFAHAPIGTRVSIGGPIGDAHLRDGSDAKAILVAGSGTGLAPIKSIVAQSLINAPHRPITILSLNDHYLNGYFEKLAQKHPSVAVKSLGDQRALDRLEKHLEETFDCSQKIEIYAAGSPKFVDVITRETSRLGAPRSAIYSDVFFTPEF